MDFNFRKIPAKEPLYKQLAAFHKEELSIFEDYARSLSNLPNNQKAKSGKGRSYAMYLIRLIIIYEEHYKEKIENILSIKTLNKLNKIKNSKEFADYNKKENNFPGSTLNCFKSYFDFQNWQAEERLDRELNDERSNYINSNVIYKKKPLSIPQFKEKKVAYGESFVYPRNLNESIKAKQTNNWTCEVNSEHTTFISSSNGKPYVEAHHLIPMAQQDLFQYTLDTAKNIVSLCPNCHRKIHYASTNAKKVLLQFLFNKKKDDLLQAKIFIELDTLLTFYE